MVIQLKLKDMPLQKFTIESETVFATFIKRNKMISITSEKMIIIAVIIIIIIITITIIIIIIIIIL